MTRFKTPFRLGSTSYVYPSDLASNARQLGEAGHVDDIELVLFHHEGGASNLPDAETIRTLGRLAAEFALTYTVHLPLDLRLADDGSASHPSLELTRRVIDLMLPLRPFAFVAHLDGTGANAAGWAERAIRALETLLPALVTPQLLAIENLESYSPRLLDPVMNALRISRAIDIGHLWKQGQDPLPELLTWLPRACVVHLHGFRETDHLSLEVMSAPLLDPVVYELAQFSGVVTLEVFSTSEFFESRATLLGSMQRAFT